MSPSAGCGHSPREECHLLEPFHSAWAGRMEGADLLAELRRWGNVAAVSQRNESPALTLAGGFGKDLSDPHGMQPFEHGFGAGIGLLALHAPVFQLFERDRGAGDGATHESPGSQYPEVSIEILHLGFAR
jgi:hypothetical protein